MKLPRDLKGSELAKALCRDWGYRIVHQEGSHLILQTELPSRQRIPIPDHNPVRLGTLNSILRLVARHKGVERDDILRSLQRGAKDPRVGSVKSHSTMLQVIAPKINLRY